MFVKRRGRRPAALARAFALAWILAGTFQAGRSQAQPVEASAAGPGAAPATASGVVNINSATAAELERLPGIGPARAKAILELRARVAHFTRVEDLLRVKGIGRATFRKLRPYLVLEGETTLKD